MTDGAASKLLQQQFKRLLSEPIEGFAAELPDESNLFNWRIYAEGPKGTMYEGGVFQLQMSYPKDYPMSPPELRFISEFWHPNVYADGKVCISILHPPGEDEMSGELPEERWLPTQSPATILLSTISLLSDPNFSSPANVDASVQWRRDIHGFKSKIRGLVEKANSEFDGHIKIPHPDTDPEEKAKALERIKELTRPMDFYDDFEDYDDGADYGDDDDAGSDGDYGSGSDGEGGSDGEVEDEDD